MIRTQVQLTEEQVGRMRAAARSRGVSMAQAIRDAVDNAGGETDVDRRHRRALGVVAKFASGRSDAATAHDRELARIYDE